MKITPLFSAMEISASGLAAQRKRMNVIAENLANAETTRTSEGGPYRRKQARFRCEQFSEALQASSVQRDLLAQTNENHLPGRETVSEQLQFQGVLAEITPDSAPFREVYDPSHPDADANGIVRMPNVDIVQEMTELISASRAFEANATAFNASKNMMKKALEL